MFIPYHEESMKNYKSPHDHCEWSFFSPAHEEFMKHYKNGGWGWDFFHPNVKEYIPITKVNTVEYDDGVILQIPFPGINKDNVQLHMDGDYLIIESGELDFNCKSFVSDKFDRSKFTAKCKDGILDVKMPHLKTAKILNIEVE